MNRRSAASPKAGAIAPLRDRPRAESDAAFVPPYPPSWVDRLTGAVDRLPGPAWLAYLIAAAIAVTLQLALQSTTADYRAGPFLPFQVWLLGYFAYLMGMIHYLDRFAAGAIDKFHPVLDLTTSGDFADVPRETFAGLRYRLTTLPARPTAWASLLGGLVLGFIPILFVRDPVSGPLTLSRTMTSFGFSATPLSLSLTLAQFFLTQAIAGALVYHTIHQLRLIDHIYVRHTRVNLYRLQPLYAFSVLAALTAGGLLLFTYAWFAVSPSLLDQLASRALAIFFAGIAVVTFLWPLWGMHRRLVEEKKRLLQESSARFEAAVAQVHQRVDRQRLTRMDDLNKTLASLEIEQNALRRIPTWPWEPGTVRGVAAALLLPIFIWVAQQVLGRFLAG